MKYVQKEQNKIRYKYKYYNWFNRQFRYTTVKKGDMLCACKGARMLIVCPGKNKVSKTWYDSGRPQKKFQTPTSLLAIRAGFPFLGLKLGKIQGELPNSRYRFYLGHNFLPWRNLKKMFTKSWRVKRAQNTFVLDFSLFFYLRLC